MDRTIAAGAERNDQLDAVFRTERRRLWGLAYRLTGSVEDADDVVQEAFARLAAQPESFAVSEAAPWLVRTATNLGIDALRRRRRRAYVGPWLPVPLADDGPEAAAEGAPLAAGDPERLYGIAESATFAFLVALEALSPKQRAVLLLRDVLGHSSRDAAELLGATEGAVRILHLRARRALAAYDASRCVPSPALYERHRSVLERFLACLAAGDARGLEALLAESVVTITDAAGEYTALTKPIAGRAPVARFYLVAALHRRAGGSDVEIVQANGLPAALVRLRRPERRQAPSSLLRIELDGDGRIGSVHAILAPRKLAAFGPA